MKSVTEFATYALNTAIKLKTDLLAEGKTLEEVQTKLGESFKFEGDKLKHFVNAIEVAATNLENLSRVLVVTLNEGEAAPAKSNKVEEHHYVPEFKQQARQPVMTKTEARGGAKKSAKGSGPKESPWGLTPEQKAAKKGGAAGKAKPAT
jgi:hypothetical protein